MESKRNENLFKVFLSTFEYYKKNVSKKDKNYKDFKETHGVLKETSIQEFCNMDCVKKYSTYLISALETSNLKLIEKCLTTVDYFISHELIETSMLLDMVKEMLTHLYNKSMLNDDNVNYKILNLCIIIYSSKQLNINGVNLINMIKVCLNIFLSSKNPDCRNMAKLTLIQIVEALLNKLEVVYNVFNAFHLNNNYNSNFFTKSSKSRNTILTEEGQKEYYKEATLSNELESYISKYMYQLTDWVVISSTLKETNLISGLSQALNSKTEVVKLLNNLNLEESNAKFSKDDNLNLPGKYGWCISCRGQANFFSERLNFSVCSNECETDYFHLQRSIDFDITVDSTSYRDDYINTLKILSKLSIKESKQQNYIEQINLKLREFCLELIHTLISKGAKFFLNEPKLITVIKESTMDSLVKNTLSNEMNIFKLSVNLFLTIITNFREHLKDQIEVFINRVLIAILESENLGFGYKEIILDSLTSLAENCNFLVEIYINYDCDINHKSVFYDIINLMTKIIQGAYKKPKYQNTFKPLQEASLRIRCLDFLTIFIKNLAHFVETNQGVNNLNNFNNFQSDMASMTQTYYSSKGFKGPVNDVTVFETEEDLNSSIFIDGNFLDHKDKINQNLKMKSIISKAVDKFNINPSNAFNYLKALDWLPSENNFNSLKQNLLNKLEETGLSEDSLHKGNFFYNYHYVLNLMSRNKLEILNYEDFFAEEISRFIRCNLKDLNKVSLGNFLCGSKVLNKKVLGFFIESYNFRNFHLFEAMRILLSDFNLGGEAQIVDRLVQIFGQKYHKDNPNVFRTPDVAYYIGFSIMMLNTDLHRDEIGEKMPLKKFISNVYLLCSKEDIDESYLIDVYSRVQNNPLIIPGQKLNIHSRNKKDLIKMEKESIMKSTFEELQTKNLISREYVITIDNDHVKNLIDASWSNFLGIFSVLLADFEEEAIVNTCIDNILLMARMCGYLRLDTIAEAFVNTIINMTNIMEGREIKGKNLDCAKALVQFAVQSGVYIRTSWLGILNIVSKIDYYHTIGGQMRTEAENFAKEIRRRSKLKNPEKEIDIELKNTELICRNISILFCDNIFSKSASFDEEGIVNFVSSLCKVSRTELESFFNPRNYSLHKLVEVADFNIFRIQIEWGKIWKLLSDHLVYVATTYNHDNICNDAIDSLRQIVTKLLQKSDLAVYNFQIDFFKPFEIIFQNSVNRPDRSELILTCLSFILQNSKNIHSGWIIIFNILKAGLRRRDARIDSEVLRILQTISEDFYVFDNSNAEVFRGYIECLCHMYLEENLKKISFETILKLVSKLFQNLSHNISLEVKFEFLKIFFYGFDDLLKINVIEHLNLLFEVISYNREVIFSSDIYPFVFIYFAYFKPHIVSLAINKLDYRLKLFHEEGSLELISSNLFKTFTTKNSIDDVYRNCKSYLEDSLKQMIETCDLSENESGGNNEEKTSEKTCEEKCMEQENTINKDGISVNLLNNSKTEKVASITTKMNFFYSCKNGGNESKKPITNFLKNLIKNYDQDSELLIKKIEILRTMESSNFEIALEFFLEKFWLTINKVSETYMNYKFFYEDLLITLMNLSIFSSSPELVFKVLGKSLLSIGNELSASCWTSIKNIVNFLLTSIANLKLQVSEENLQSFLPFIHAFSIFFRDIVLNFFDLFSSHSLLLVEEYKLLNAIHFKILSLDLENSYSEYKIIDSFLTLDILKMFSKTKYLILEKSDSNKIKNYYDNSGVTSLDYMNKIFQKYHLAEEEKNELVEIIEFELIHLLPKFLKFLDTTSLESIFYTLVDLIESQNTQLRTASKFLLKQFANLKLISFVNSTEI